MTEFYDERRPIDRYLGNYAEDHRHPTNRLIHWICVPLILWSVLAAIYAIPVPAALGKPGLWAALACVAASAFYLRLSIRLGLAMVAVLVLLLALCWWLYSLLGAQSLLITAGVVFVLAWLGQFYGHKLEGAKPSFLTDLVYLLIGPLWLVSKTVRRVGMRW